jgi:hypothetical protein
LRKAEEGLARMTPLWEGAVWEVSEKQQGFVGMQNSNYHA